MLTFISFCERPQSFWADLASSAYYAGGDAEKVIGKSAPWFILAVMLFSYAVARALYRIEQHVCARRSVPRGERGHGWHAGQVFSFSAAF